MVMTAENPVEYVVEPLPPGGAAVSDWHSPCAWPQPVGPPSGKLMFLMNSRFSACGASTLVAVSADPARPVWVRAPVAVGKKFFPTPPHAATMNRVNTGGASADQAERAGSPSRKGRPMATAPAPRRNARRFTLGKLDFEPFTRISSLRRACGTRRF